MAVMDEFKEERESLKGAPFKKKAEYFWMYYKWYVIGSVSVILLATYIVLHILSAKDDVLTAIAINAKETDRLTAFTDDFLTNNGYDLKKNQFDITLNLTMGQGTNALMQRTDEIISAQMYSKSLDLLIMEQRFFDGYAYGCNCMDLSVYLSPEVLSLFEGRIYYVDLPVAEEYVDRLNKNKPVEDMIIPDPTKPETMKDPHPVGIDLSDYPEFLEALGYEEGPICLGVVKNTKRIDNVSKFLVYLSSYERN